MTDSRLPPRWAYDQAMKELKMDDIDPGLQAMAFAHSPAKQPWHKLYIELRAKEIVKEYRRRKEQEEKEQRKYEDHMRLLNEAEEIQRLAEKKDQIDRYNETGKYAIENREGLHSMARLLPHLGYIIGFIIGYEIYLYPLFMSSFSLKWIILLPIALVAFLLTMLVWWAAGELVSRYIPPFSKSSEYQKAKGNEVGFAGKISPNKPHRILLFTLVFGWIFLQGFYYLYTLPALAS